jgi:hypothetical protein
MAAFHRGRVKNTRILYRFEPRQPQAAADDLMEHFTPVPLAWTGFPLVPLVIGCGRTAAWVAYSTENRVNRTFLGQGPRNVASTKL